MGIIQYPDKRLRIKCRNVERISNSVRKDAGLILSELRLMDNHLLFVNGLAANQVGIDKRIIILKMLGNRFVTMVNPEVISSWLTFFSFDLCASIPRVIRLKKRKLVIKLRYLGLDNRIHKKTLFGSTAFTAQQELDHLDGRLIID
jgi:peptide deformylase